MPLSIETRDEVELFKLCVKSAEKSTRRRIFAVCAAVFCGVQAIRRSGGVEGIALIAYLPILFGACILATVVHGVCIAVSARARKAYPRSSIVFILFSAAFIAVYAVFLGLLFLD